MFEHSIKVPRLYKTAAKIAQKVKEDGASLKQMVYEQKHQNIKALYAITLHTLQNDDNINAIIRHSQILTKEKRLDPWLARVLITELLWGKKKLPPGSKPVETVLSYEGKFLEDFVPQKKTKLKRKKVIKPKYVRINTLKMTVDEAVSNFRDEGWSLVRCGNGSDYAAFLATAASLSEDQFMLDIHVKDLLLFPPGAEFYEHKLYKAGYFVVQDKASCLAPLLLNPPVGATVLDMCSAPGMKCMQLAAMIEKTGQVYAVERDQRRFETLKNLVEKADATNVKTLNKDVLTLTDKDISNVEYILVDPSCSGSGMLDRVEFEDENVKCNELRLQKLAGFQITLLRHALNNFKFAKRIVYSTCSIFSHENEEVVKQAITTTTNFKLIALNELFKDKWYNFGSKDFGKIGESCLYARPEIDHTNGFFIAVFERLNEGETNDLFVKRIYRSSECMDDNQNDGINMNTDVIENIKKYDKKRKKHPEDTQDEITNSLESSQSKFKSKKHKSNKNNFELVSQDNVVVEESTKSKKKKRKKTSCTKNKEETIAPNITENITLNSEKITKKKKLNEKDEIMKRENKKLKDETNELFISEGKTKEKKKQKKNIQGNVEIAMENLEKFASKSLKRRHVTDDFDETVEKPQNINDGVIKKKKKRRVNSEKTEYLNHDETELSFENHQTNIKCKIKNDCKETNEEVVYESEKKNHKRTDVFNELLKNEKLLKKKKVIMKDEELIEAVDTTYVNFDEQSYGGNKIKKKKSKNEKEEMIENENSVDKAEKRKHKVMDEIRDNVIKRKHKFVKDMGERQQEKRKKKRNEEKLH